MKPAGFGELLKRARERLALTQQEVADELIKIAWAQRKARVGVDRQMVSKWEREVKLPDRLYRDLLCMLFGATEEQLGLCLRPSAPVNRGLLLPVGSLQFESPLDIVERAQRLSRSSVGNDTIDRFDDIIKLISETYESSGPASLATRVVQQRKSVQEILDGRQQPKQRDRLYGIASKLSAILGYMAVNLGKFSVADAYCKEAFILAEMLGDTDMQAWIRGTESFCAYYKSEYQLAASLARDGLRYARGGPQAVRLAINGEARALGKLGDRAGVGKAVKLADELTGRFETTAGVSSCISFGIYSPARTAANAATAYVSLGMPKEVEEYSQQVTPAMEASDSCWTQSLVRLDVATAMILAKRPEPESAARLVTEALTISAERPVTSVLTRSQEFIASTGRWSDLPALAEAAETLRAAAKR